MILRTQATALLIRPWSNTSHMVTWLTPDHGRVVTTVKGACRPKSAFLGQYDLFYTCDLLFYRRDREGVHAIRECTPLNLREPLRLRWRQAAAAAYLTDLTARAVPSHHEAAAAFELLNRTLDLLAAPEPPPTLETLLWYELHLLRHLGLLPDLTLCPRCHTPDQTWLRFSLSAGRLLCSHRSTPLPGEVNVTLPRDLPGLFRTLRRLPAPREVQRLLQRAATRENAPPQNLLLGLSRFLGMFMAFHLDVPPAVRRVTWEMLDITPAQKPALLENSKS